MLIHGRFIVTKNGLMLDEVKSLLQKSLRRGERSLTYKAAKELIGEDKTQLKWQNLVTFMFEDHCLNHVAVFEELFELYRRKDMLGGVELISKCYTCRHSACLQVIAVSEKHRNYETFWDGNLPEESEFRGMVTHENEGINCALLLANIVKKWRERDANSMVSLFGLVNMAGKVEGKKLTKEGKDSLLDNRHKTATLYHLVLSTLYKKAEDEYMKRLIAVCFRFSCVPETPQGLIMFTVLTQLMFKTTVLSKPVPDTRVHQVDWEQVGKLDTMPDWAVDKHTYRGKFGKSSKHLFLRKFKNMNLSDEQLELFHGERSRADIQHFFDIGCICNNEIMSENPIWEAAKAVYLQQKPSLQKCAKLTKLFYNELLEQKSVVMVKETLQKAFDYRSEIRKRKKKVTDDVSKINTKKMKFTDSFRERKESVAANSHSLLKEPNRSTGTCTSHPEGPLLQLPTGSGKVYTVLDLKTEKVWKGPFKAKARQDLCVFYHRAMKQVFGDKHTMELEENGQYVIFPLLKSNDADVSVKHREFFDCISKRVIPEEEGMFVERDSLGIVQLHKISLQEIRSVPATVWAHFAWRYVLNIGDTGLYNAIATKDLSTIYGIDMEERRKQVKGNDLLNMLFGKLPRKDILKEIEKSILAHVEEFYSEISKDIDFDKLGELYKKHHQKNETERCKERIVCLVQALDSMCKRECGV